MSPRKWDLAPDGVTVVEAVEGAPPGGSGGPAERCSLASPSDGGTCGDAGADHASSDLLRPGVVPQFLGLRDSTVGRVVRRHDVLPQCELDTVTGALIRADQPVDETLFVRPSGIVGPRGCEEARPYARRRWMASARLW